MNQDSRQPRSKRSIWGILREIALILIIALLISTVVRTWVVRSFFIPSASMEQTLQIGDRILVNQLPWPDVERGDVIVFDDPGGWLDPTLTQQYQPNPVLEFLGLVPADAGQQLIKRVVGVGGDTVECCDDQGRILVNGEPIDEPYLAPGAEASSTSFQVTVPDGHYWVMGDNRPNSLDSRYNVDSEGGPYVPEDDVVGIVFFINWPLERIRGMGTPEEVFAGVPQP
ncbi:hypothetical protein GCM10022261_24650 [Brevibacterium daeguense]|uniref:Signal peptidase I n=1 Tax=Brevibacterium daeguense TaxID=909936 RepID=A0ABP8ELR4_9MICO